MTRSRYVITYVSGYNISTSQSELMLIHTAKCIREYVLSMMPNIVLVLYCKGAVYPREGESASGEP